MKKEHICIIALVLAHLIVTLPITSALTISDVKTEVIKHDAALVNWTTDVAADTMVDFGTTTGLGSARTDVNQHIHHPIWITGLTENTNYFFKVTSNDGTGTVTSDNQGNLYSFRTAADEPPIINTTLPRYYNGGNKITIEVRTDPSSIVDVFVNDLATPKQRGYADSHGLFIAPDVNLITGDNEIRIQAEDPAGQIRFEDYTVTVDLISPEITLAEEIPSITSEEELNISGSVSEPSKIDLRLTFLDEDDTPPAKVTGLNTTRIDQNSVDLNWDANNETDLNMYIVYRDNVRLTKTTRTDFGDAPDSGRTYSYQVSAIDRSCNEGPRSDALEVTTLTGGSQLNLTIEEEPLGCEKGETIRINATDTFSHEFELDNDGFYELRIRAIDKASNFDEIIQRIYLDTEPPEIEILKPLDKTFIFEQFADDIKITGKTDPNTKVYLYVLRTPLGKLNDSVDVYGIPDEVQHIPDADLGADSGKSTRADYDTRSDENGLFEFDHVDLTSSIALGYTIQEVNYGDLQDQRDIDTDTRTPMKSNLLFLATDTSGKRGAAKIDYDIGTCWSGDFNFAASPLINLQSPTFLSTERIAEGTESLYFYFNFTFVGDVEYRPTHDVGEPTAYVTSVRVESACDDMIIEDRRYNYSCAIMPKSATRTVVRNNVTFVVMKLKRYQEMDQWTDTQWQDFYRAISQEMRFPLRFDISYRYKYGGNQSGAEGEQTFCDEVTYVVDSGRLNPQEILPDWLLYDLVDNLEDWIEDINGWIDKIKKIMRYLVTACVVSFIVKLGVQIYRRFVCHFDDFARTMKKLGDSLTSEQEQDRDECTECLRTIDGKSGDLLKTRQNDMSDTCLEICSDTCFGAWETEANLYSLFRWSCDRVFGHSAPSKWTETVSDSDLYKKQLSGSGCANDQSVMGQPIRAVKCRTIAEQYNQRGIFVMRIDDDQDCWEVMANPTDRYARYLYSNPEIENENQKLYLFEKIEGRPGSGQPLYAIKQTSSTYLTRQNQKCSAVCGIDDADANNARILESQDRNAIISKVGQPLWSCRTVKSCIDLGGESDDGLDVKPSPRGYTADCFYGATSALSDPEVVSSEEEERYECCCINAKKSAGGQYYSPEDVETKDGGNPGTAATSADGYKNMKWSYRYSTIKWRAKSGAIKYNPNRYTEERDQPACFGFNNWWLDTPPPAEGETGNLLIMNPAKQIFSAIQCAAVNQVLARLQLIVNIMQALRNCLVEVRTTGRADAGVCKEIFTQYVCSFLWSVISWIRDGCIPFGAGHDLEGQLGAAGEVIRTGVSSIFDSVRDTQREVASEYGNAQLNNLLGASEQAVARKICLWAFGYDWEINIEDILDVTYSTPSATLVMAPTPGREYLAFDDNGKSIYEYRSSWIINPGCDMDDYDIYLTCVSRDDLYEHPGINCERQSDPWGSNCDCLAIAPDRMIPDKRFFDGRKLTRNQLEDRDHHDIITSDFRYDHLKFVLKPDRDIIRDRGDPSQCFPDGHTEGNNGIFYFPIKDYSAIEIRACVVDAATGRFDCSVGASMFNPYGSATINRILLEKAGEQDLNNPGATLYAGESITPTVEYYKDERQQCLVARLYEADMKTLKGNQPAAKPLRQGLVGTHTVDIGSIYTIPETDVSGAAIQPIILPEAFTYSVVSSSNVQQGRDTIRFIDADGSGIALASGSMDTVSINNANPQPISNFCTGGNCVFTMPNTRIAVRISTAKAIEYTVEVPQPGQQTQATSVARYYLHIDIRHPRQGNDNCEDVKGVEYDGNILVQNGRKQSYDIPIYVMPGKRGNECAAEFERTRAIPQDKPCKCGITSDCHSEGASEKYCYGKCRVKPRCADSVALTSACVCDPTIPADKFDCGAARAYVQGDAPQDRQGWYCNAQTNKCQSTAPPVAPVADTLPPTITVLRIGGLVIPSTGRPPDASGAYLTVDEGNVEIEAEVQDQNLNEVKLMFGATELCVLKAAGDAVATDHNYKCTWNTGDLPKDTEYTVRLVATDKNNRPSYRPVAGEQMIKVRDDVGGQPGQP